MESLQIAEEVQVVELAMICLVFAQFSLDGKLQFGPNRSYMKAKDAYFLNIEFVLVYGLQEILFGLAAKTSLYVSKFEHRPILLFKVIFGIVGILACKKFMFKCTFVWESPWWKILYVLGVQPT